MEFVSVAAQIKRDSILAISYRLPVLQETKLGARNISPEIGPLSMSARSEWCWRCAAGDKNRVEEAG